MTLFLRNLPIKQKFIAITVVISGVALLLACAAFAVYEQVVFRRAMARDFAILASMFSENVASGIAFNDAASIEKTLATLTANPRVVAACACDNGGTVVGAFHRAGAAVGDDFKFPVGQRTSQRFGAERLDTFKEIKLGGEVIGVVYIGAELGEIRERAWRYAAIVSLLLVGCSLVALALASRLQRIISQPIEDLAQTVATVTTRKDYAVRARKESDDELGRLIDGFNEMLTQIQARDVDLQMAHDQLEERVATRTHELQRENTERQRAEAGLAYERDQLRALLDASPDKIYFKDRHSRFVLCSQSKAREVAACVADLRECRAAQGLSAGVPERELLIGLTDFDTFQSDDARLAYEDEQQIIRTGEAMIGKLEKQTRRDDTVRWSLTSKMPWRDREGKCIGTFGLSKDITDLKVAEQKLEQVHRQLIQASRKAGMAEVATGVLHNVGNVLNSVNVSATLVTDRLRQTKANNIAKVAALLDQHKADLAGFVTQDPRGRALPTYLTVLAEQVAAEQAGLRTELDHLRKNIEHIKDIVALQQNHAKSSGFIEAVSLVELVEDALRVNAGSLARHHIEVGCDFQVRPVIDTDKHKIVQILINLLRNAKFACDEAGRPDKRITVRIAGGPPWVRISVQDNGVGIPGENLVRIFSHGFTTRKDGHGFGLHSGALAARELGGSLTVQSDGPGRGASFTLELPLKPDPLAHENSRP